VYEFVKYEKSGKIAIVTINRPEVLNALHPPSNEEFVEIWLSFEQDPDARVAILTGAGDRAFSTGFDLKWAASHGLSAPATKALPFAGLAYRPDDSAPPALTKPIIAAVNGLALGGGTELALACDLIVASDQATFALTEAKLGLIPLGGGVHWLPRHIPLKRAMALLLTGNRLSAREAFGLGLVNEVVPHGDLLSAADDLAHRIIRCGPLATRAIKQAVYEGLALPYEVAQRRRYTIWDEWARSGEGAEGIAAFSEKRPPNWVE